MSESQKQLLIDINNISCSLSEEDVKKIEKVAINLLDISLLKTMPNLELSELKELDTTEKLMLLREYSLSEEERRKWRSYTIWGSIKRSGVDYRWLTRLI